MNIEKLEWLMNRYEEEIQGREAALFHREEKLRSAKKSIYKRIEALRKDNTRLIENNNYLEKRAQAEYESKNRIKIMLSHSVDKARKFDELKAILAE